jgi:hypothetical protein
MRSPRFLLGLGLFLMLSGIVVPFLMILRVLPTGFALSFLSWGASVAGLALGTIGVAMMVGERRDR